MRFARFLVTLFLMLFTQRWLAQDPRTWKTSWSRLLHQFDTGGYECMARKSPRGGASEYEVLMPGLDSLMIQYPAQNQANAESGALATLQRLTCERVEILIDPESGAVSARLIYWSPLQILMHTLITFMVGLETFSIVNSSDVFLRLWTMVGSFLLMSFIPVAMSLTEMHKLEKLFKSAGFSAQRK